MRTLRSKTDLPTLALPNRFKGSKAFRLTLSRAAAPLAYGLVFQFLRWTFLSTLGRSIAHLPPKCNPFFAWIFWALLCSNGARKSPCLVAKKQHMLPKCYQKQASKPWGTRGSKLEVSGMATRMLPAALFILKSAAFFMSCPRFRILFPGVRGVTQSCTAKTPQNPPKPGHFPGKLSGFLGSLAAKSKKEEFQ